MGALVVVAIVVLALGAAACGKPPGPRGWAGAQPVTVEGRNIVLAAYKAHLYALPEGSGTINWQFPPSDRDSYPVSQLARVRLVSQLDDTGVSDEAASTINDRISEMTVSGPSGDTTKNAIDTARDNSTDDAVRDRLTALKDAIDAVRVAEKDALTHVRALYGEIAVSEDGATAYVPTYGGWLFALDIDSGETSWIFDADDGMVGGATVDGDTIYVGTKGDELLAIDAAAAELRWSFGTGGEVWSAPAVVDGDIYVSSLDGTLHKLDESGQELWSFSDAGSGIASSPVVDGDTVYIGSFDNKLYAIDAANGDMRWSVEADNWFWGAPAVDGDMVYAASLDGKVYAIDAASGDVQWTFDAGAPVRSSPVLAGGGVVVATRKGEVHKINVESGEAEGGTVMAGTNVEANLSVDAEDNVYVVPRSSTLYVIDATGGLVAATFELP